MRILVKAKESGGKDIRLFIPIFLAANRITFGLIWGNVKVKIDKWLPLEKQEIYALYRVLLKELKSYKGLELIDVSKKGKKIVSIVV